MGRVFGDCLRGCRLSAGFFSAGTGGEVRAECPSDQQHGEAGAPGDRTGTRLHRLADALGLADEARAGFICAADRRLACAESTPGGPVTGEVRWVGSGNAGAQAAAGRGWTPFVGRAGELGTLDKLANEAAGGRGDRVVILAIRGTAGVGKDRARRALGPAGRPRRFPDGQLYVNLRGYDPSGQPVVPCEAVHGFLDALGVP